MTLFKTIAAMTLAIGLAAPAAAQDLSPVGIWQTTTGESRFAVSYCGDGTQICAKLTWLRRDARKPENVAMLNQLVVNGARPVGENQWRGTVKYDGQIVDGSVKLVDEDSMQLSGCMLIACKNVDFVRR